MIFSAATGYALRALASMPEDRRFHLTRHLAEQLDLPGPYLAKVLKQLARAGVLDSARGPRGGFRLALPADQISVGDVVCLLAPYGTPGCILGLPTCVGRHGHCPFQPACSAARASFEWALATTTIRDLQPFDRLCRSISSLHHGDTEGSRSERPGHRSRTA